MKHLLTLFVLLFTLTACHNDTDEPEPSNKQAHRTVLVYMVAQNLSLMPPCGPLSMPYEAGVCMGSVGADSKWA